MYSASAYNRFADLFSENDTGGMLEWFWEHEHVTEPLSAGRPEANNALYLLLKTKNLDALDGRVLEAAINCADLRWDHCLALSLALQYEHIDLFKRFLPLVDPSKCVPPVDLQALRMGRGDILELLSEHLDLGRDQSALLQNCAMEHPEHLGLVWKYSNPFDAVAGLAVPVWSFVTKTESRKAIGRLRVFSETAAASLEDKKSWETFSSIIQGDLSFATKEAVSSLSLAVPNLLSVSVALCSAKTTKHLLGLNVLDPRTNKSEALRLSVLHKKHSLVGLLAAKSDASSNSGVAILNAVRQKNMKTLKTLLLSMSDEKIHGVVSELRAHVAKDIEDQNMLCEATAFVSQKRIKNHLSTGQTGSRKKTIRKI